MCDLAKLEDIPGLVQNIIDKYGRIDILVNNAGIHLKKGMAGMQKRQLKKQGRKLNRASGP
jgi:NAD(P)-dependent dehydrogenase (short-subunit alcohol dehydrogenase family)